MDLVELDDLTNGVGVTLIKTIETLRGAFLFSTSVELNTKGAGEREAGREMIDSNTSLPSILTPKHFSGVSAICFERWDLAVLAFQTGSWHKAVAGRFVLPRL